MIVPASVISDWVLVSQEQIDLFADATNDHQWLHVDRERAARESPFGAPIAHGFLTLSLISSLLRRSTAIGEGNMAVNYGLNRVRFVAPVVAGTRVRGRFAPQSVEEKPDATKVVWKATIEREDGRPCCVAEWIVLYYR